MPELAEVEYYRRQWREVDEPVTEVLLHPKARIFRKTDTALLPDTLAGSQLERSEAHGKQLLFVFGNKEKTEKTWLFVHLGMTGKLHTQPASFEPGRHDHLVLRQFSQSLVFTDSRMFGAVRAEFGAEPPEAWAKRPPAIPGPAFTIARVTQALLRHARLPLKALLLHQAWFPGVGNWMADEILFQSHFNPRAKAGSLGTKEGKTLWKVTRAVAKTALDTIGQDWSDPPKTWLFSHRWKAGSSCPACGTALSRETVGGRTTCWCGTCQPSSA